MAHITFLASDNCMASSIAGMIDALSIANFWWQYINQGQCAPLFHTTVVSIDGRPVAANGGLTISAETAMDSIEQTDVIIGPAFLPPFDFDNPQTEAIIKWFWEHYDNDTAIASTCTGSFLLARAGLLDGKIATTNWMLAGLFKKYYPKVDLRVDKMFTEDDGVMCTGAATAFLNLCMHEIERFGSRELALQCSKALLFDPDRQSQSPYMTYEFKKTHADTQILKAQEIMEKNYSQRLSMDDMAKDLGLSPRHFKRRFKNATSESPLSYLQRLRIEEAKRRLETNTQSIGEITWQVGYEDMNSFRKLFRKHTGMSPKSYRNKFA